MSDPVTQEERDAIERFLAERGAVRLPTIEPGTVSEIEPPRITDTRHGFQNRPRFQRQICAHRANWRHVGDAAAAVVRNLKP